MTPTQHKQHLIDSIYEMQSFINKIIGNIQERRETITSKSLATFYGIIDRKNENIHQFKQLLKEQYNHTID